MYNIIVMNGLAVALWLICAPLSAQELARMPTTTDVNGTAYISGGIGDQELQQVNQASRDFNLKLILAEKSGAYAADVKIDIANAKGKPVLDVPAAGPILLTRLAPGKYRIRAAYQQREQQKEVNVRAGGPQTVSFYW